MHYFRKSNPIFKMLNSSLIDLPAMINLSHFWNFGSLLGVTFMLQLSTGIFLAMHYSSDIDLAFNCVDHIIRDVDLGWLLRLSHSNGASLFFAFIYLHISRSLIYNSFLMKSTWNSGVFILLMTMLISFLGYVLPWGQMSFWGATVITNLLSAIPFLGPDMVVWLWGGFSVGKATLSRFFSFHYFFPFLLAFMIIFHLVFLHENKSSNPIGLSNSLDKVPFGPYYQMKDFLSWVIFFCLFFLMNFLHPFILMDAENFSMANPMVTPPHIQPEWYFLFAYAILRAIPNKLGGVVALVMSIFILLAFSLTEKQTQYKNINFNMYFFYCFSFTFLFLTWLGMKPVETPFVLLSQIFSFFHFFIVILWVLHCFVMYVLKTLI